MIPLCASGHFIFGTRRNTCHCFSVVNRNDHDMTNVENVNSDNSNLCMHLVTKDGEEVQKLFPSQSDIVSHQETVGLIQQQRRLLSSLKLAHRADLADAVARVETEMTSKHVEEMSSQRALFDRELAERLAEQERAIAERHHHQICELEERWQARLNQEKKKVVDHLTAVHEADLKRLRSGHAEELANTTLECEKLLEQMKKDHGESLEKLQQEAATELQAQLKQMSEVHQREMASLNGKLTVLQEEHKALIARLKVENNNALKKMAVSHDQQMQEILSLHVQEQNQLRSELKEAMSRLQREQHRLSQLEKHYTPLRDGGDDKPKHTREVLAEKENFEQTTPAKVPREYSFHPAEEKNREELAQLTEDHETQKKALLIALKEKAILEKALADVRDSCTRQELALEKMNTETNHLSKKLNECQADLKQECKQVSTLKTANAQLQSSLVQQAEQTCHLKQEHDEELAKTIVHYSLIKASISVQHEQSLADTHLERKEELEDLRDRLAQEHRANLIELEARLSKKHQSQVQLLHLKFEENLAEQVSKVKAQAEEDHAKNVKELTESLELEQEAALADMLCKLEEEKSHSIAAVKAESAKKLNSVMDTAQAAHEKLTENHRLQEQLLRIEYEREVSEVRTQAKEEHTKYIKELAESLEEECNRSIAAIKAAHKEEVKELRERNLILEEKMEEKERLLAKHEEQMEQLQGSFEQSQKEQVGFVLGGQLYKDLFSVHLFCCFD